MRLRIAERMKSPKHCRVLDNFQWSRHERFDVASFRIQDDFLKEHGVKLGYMSAFVKACAQALKEIPAVNARIDAGTQEIVYNDFVDISVAVAPKNLVLGPQEIVKENLLRK